MGYAELGRLIGGVHQRAIGYTLGPIQEYCLLEKLPPLTLLVVQKGTGLPGGGFIAWDVDDVETGLERVYSYPWRTLPNPFSYAKDTDDVNGASLARQLVKTPESADDVMAKVQVRGVAQRIFRLALLEAYAGACAFCGMTFSEALEAAHIVSWARCAKFQRLDPRNGILLCRTHHALFDEGHLRIDEQYRVLHEEQYPAETYSLADIWLTKEIHGRIMNLPSDERLHPDPRCIRLRYAEALGRSPVGPAPRSGRTR